MNRRLVVALAFGAAMVLAGASRVQAFSFFDGDLHDAQVLGARQRGALTGSAAGNQKVNACLDLTLDESAQSIFVQR